MGSPKTEAGLLSRVRDFEPMNEEAGEDEYSDGKTEQAKDGNKRRDGFGQDRENCQGTVDGQTDGAEMLQIESDAQPLGPGRKDRSDGFPSHYQNARNDGVLEEQAESEEDGAVAKTCESRYQKIGAQLAEAGAVKDVRSALGTKARVDEAEASENGCLEECDGNNRAGKKFSNDQDFFSYRNQELVMESALDHFAAE